MEKQQTFSADSSQCWKDDDGVTYHVGNGDKFMEDRYHGDNGVDTVVVATQKGLFSSPRGPETRTLLRGQYPDSFSSEDSVSLCPRGQ